MMALPGMEYNGGGVGGIYVAPPPPTESPDDLLARKQAYYKARFGEQPPAPDTATLLEGGIITTYAPPGGVNPWTGEIVPLPSGAPAPSASTPTVSPCSSCVFGSAAVTRTNGAPSAPAFSAMGGASGAASAQQAGFPWWLALAIFGYFLFSRKG
jgi:hypothetical protein